MFHLNLIVTIHRQSSVEQLHFSQPNSQLPFSFETACETEKKVRKIKKTCTAKDQSFEERHKRLQPRGYPAFTRLKMQEPQPPPNRSDYNQIAQDEQLAIDTFNELNSDVREDNQQIQQNVHSSIAEVREQSPRVLYIYLTWATIEIIATTTILLLYWSQPCDKPLRWFLLGFTLRFLLLVPLNLHRFQRLRAGFNAETTRRLLVLFDFLALGLFIFGQAWLFQSETCVTTAPVLYWYTVAIIIAVYITIALPIVLLLGLCLCWPCVMVVMEWLAEPEGASEEQINKLPRRAYDGPTSGDDAGQCSICLDNYKVGDEVRQLPCKHEFHMSCVDHWLKLKKDCPLCRSNITAPPV